MNKQPIVSASAVVATRFASAFMLALVEAGVPEALLQKFIDDPSLIGEELIQQMIHGETARTLRVGENLDKSYARKVLDRADAIEKARKDHKGRAPEHAGSERDSKYYLNIPGVTVVTPDKLKELLRDADGKLLSAPCYPEMPWSQRQVAALGQKYGALDPIIIPAMPWMTLEWLYWAFGVPPTTRTEGVGVSGHQIIDGVSAFLKLSSHDLLVRLCCASDWLRAQPCNTCGWFVFYRNHPSFLNGDREVQEKEAKSRGFNALSVSQAVYAIIVSYFVAGTMPRQSGTILQTRDPYRSGVIEIQITTNGHIVVREMSGDGKTVHVRHLLIGGGTE